MKNLNPVQGFGHVKGYVGLAAKKLRGCSELVFKPLSVCVRMLNASCKWNEAVVKSAAPGPARPKSYTVAFAPCSLCAARCLCLAFDMLW